MDATITVLAREGARGLTFRAVDAEAGVPTGTASNYFANRNDLLTQAGKRIHVRLAPEQEVVDGALNTPPSTELVTKLMRDIARRITENRVTYLALLELRLEATRRPELQATLTETIRDNLANDIQFHRDTGLPGDKHAPLMLYLAMTGLMVEQLTLPGVLEPYSADEIIESIVRRNLS